MRDVVRFCEKRVTRFLKDFPDCKTLSQLLDISASKLGTKFEEIHSDHQLNDVRTRYLNSGEKSFASLHEELTVEVFGVTFKRLSRKPWELPYVSVIDCRLDKKYRSYYTKWHELGHLLILTDQMRLAFRRTHFGLDDKDPEEALVDVIAGAFGFFPDLIKPVATGRPSFEVIEMIRQQLCPEASQQASIIGIARAWPTACILLQAQMGLKRGERRDIAQGDLGFQGMPKEVLRAIQVSPNDAARASNLVIFPNMRVPDGCAHCESKTAMRRVSGSALAFSHVSFATVRVQGPSEQILIDLRVLSIRSVLSTSVNIEPLKGEYR